ncbi:uncharacterized protein ACBR49_015632 [Aulostomus maculatus]
MSYSASKVTQRSIAYRRFSPQRRWVRNLGGGVSPGSHKTREHLRKKRTNYPVNVVIQNMRIPFLTTLVLDFFFIFAVEVPVSMCSKVLRGADVDHSGSEDLSGKVIVKSSQGLVNLCAAKAGSGTQNTSHGSSKPHLGDSGVLTKDTRSGCVFLTKKSESFFENEGLFAGVVAGGTVGLALAAAVSAVLILRCQADGEGCIRGQ